MRLTMLGRPGAGKGTQGALLAEHFGIPHISTGIMFRDAIRSGSALGALARRFIDRGHLVPDDVAIRIVEERLTRGDCKNGYILDGFPRTVAQARALDAALHSTGHELDAAVEIRISDEEAVMRIAHRWVCPECGATYFRRYPACAERSRCQVCNATLTQREDDTEETARERLAVYLVQTQPVISYYEERGRLITVNGEQSIEEVFREMVDSLTRVRDELESSGAL